MSWPAVRAGRSIDNQADLMRHPARELLAGQRTAALNALRGHLAEIGLIAPQGAHHAYGLKRMAADGFNENGEIVVPDCVRSALRSLVGQIDAAAFRLSSICKFSVVPVHCRGAVRPAAHCGETPVRTCPPGSGRGLFVSA